MRPPRSLGFERFSGVYLLAAFILVFSLWEPTLFPTQATLHSVAAERAISATVALAILVPLVGGAYDLSVGATVNFTTLLSVILLNQGRSIAFAVGASVLTGALIGAVNGFIVVRLKVNSFITTLGMASIVSAFQIIITKNAQPIPPVNERWSSLTQTQVFGFQVVVVYMLVLALVLWWGLTRTPAGRYLYAVGSSPDAAKLSGIKVGSYVWSSLICGGVLSAIAGVLYASLSGPSLTYGAGLLLPAFAAVFLGSTQITPGRFNVWGTVLAIYVLATGVKGLQLVTSVQWLDPMFSGVALIAAVGVAVARQNSGDERRRRRLSTGSPEPESKRGPGPGPGPEPEPEPRSRDGSGQATADA